MKFHLFFILSIGMVFFLVACGGSATSTIVPTAVPATASPTATSAPAPTPTPTPVAAATATPAPTDTPRSVPTSTPPPAAILDLGVLEVRVLDLAGHGATSTVH